MIYHNFLPPDGPACIHSELFDSAGWFREADEAKGYADEVGESIESGEVRSEAMADTIRVGLIKAVPVKWDVDRNWSTVEQLIRRIADRGVDLFCTPECFLDGYVTPEDDWTRERFLSIAQTEGDSSYIERARQLVRELKVWLLLGLTERVGERCYNAAFLFDRGGEVVGKYYKTHLQHHDLRYTVGVDLPVFDTEFGMLGIMICADRRWPETARTLRIKGARLIMNPTYGMWHYDNEWWMRTRSYENELYICFTHPKVSLITGPKGEVAAKLQSSVEDVLVEDLDLSQVTSNMIKDRRPKLYRALSMEIPSGDEE